MPAAPRLAARCIEFSCPSATRTPKNSTLTTVMPRHLPDAKRLAVQGDSTVVAPVCWAQALLGKAFSVQPPRGHERLGVGAPGFSCVRPPAAEVARAGRVNRDAAMAEPVQPRSPAAGPRCSPRTGSAGRARRPAGSRTDRGGRPWGGRWPPPSSAGQPRNGTRPASPRPRSQQPAGHRVYQTSPPPPSFSPPCTSPLPQHQLPPHACLSS